MSVALQVVDVTPADNADKVIFVGKLSGDYGVNGTGDPLNLAPYSAGDNPGGFTNPLQIPLPSWPLVLDKAPGVIAEDLGGSYLNPHPLVPTGETEGVQNGLALDGGTNLRVYEPGGAEKATNAAYTGGETGGNFLLELTLPHNQ